MSEAKVASARPLSQFLRMAVMAGVESAVQLHIDRGDDLNARDASGMTPLMLSAARDKPAICKLLLRAGADSGLLNRSGKTALEIALNVGAHATAAVLNAAMAPPPAPAHSESVDAPGLEGASDVSVRHKLIAEAEAPAEHNSHAAPTGEPPVGRPPPPSVAIADLFDDGEFDLSGWEAEEEPTRPGEDLAIVDSASAVQITLTVHEPIDSSAEWEDIDAYLPDVALPLARADEAEGRARLRRLLLRALREGSVPALDVQVESGNDDRSTNPEAEAYLAMVINDLGAEVDERFEYSSADESFEVFVDPEETPEEEAALDEALASIDRAASPRHEPLRIYQREFQRLRLLSAEEEIRLAKEMEAALDAALDALATWPDGIARTLAAGTAAVAGSRQLSSIWIGGEPDPEPVSTETHETEAPVRAEPENIVDEDGDSTEEAPADAGDTAFAEALRRLTALVEREDGPRASHLEISQALANLRLTRRFLLDLIDAAKGPAPCPEFRLAMAEFRKARDSMAAANLKLAFFHAKKYLHSGEPLDDLAQEGNIGLLKAVDRYDWRRGFRFSTYATWWIRQQISRHVADKVRTIRLPVHVHEKLQRAERLAQSFEATTGREPTLDELAQRVEMPRHKLAALLRIAPETCPLNHGTVDAMIAIDALDDYVSPDPEDAFDKIQLRHAVDRLVSSLSTKDRKEERILRMRFGIGVDEALTLEEIGKRFEVTRERIRQIESKAIKKLRHPVRSEPFARMSLGLEPDENPFARGTQENSRNAESDVADAAQPPPAAAKRAPSPRPKRESIEPDDSTRPTALDRLLAQAIELGIPIADDRPSSGKIWIELAEPRDSIDRRLIRKLLEFGFAFRPGKGYWK